MSELREIVNDIVIDFTAEVNTILESQPFNLSEESLTELKRSCIELAAAAQLQYVKLSLYQIYLNEEDSDTTEEVDGSFRPSSDLQL